MTTKEERTVPDGGWGWVVVICSFFVIFMIDGLSYTYGILLPYLMESFHSTPSITSLAGSLLTGGIYLAAIVAGVMVKKYGCRPVAIGGTIVATIGLVISSFSVNIFMFLVTFGALAGLGIGILHLPAIVIVNQYFDKNRGTAIGAMLVGAGIGILVISPCAELLLELYGWRGTILIFAGMYFQLCVACAFYRPVKLPKCEQTELKPLQGRQLLSSKKYILISIGIFFTQLAQNIPSMFVMKYGLSIGITARNMSWMYSGFGVAQIFGRFLPGLIVDKTSITASRLCGVGMVACAVCCFLFPLCNSYQTLMAFFTSFAFFIGFYSTLGYAMVAEAVTYEQLTNALSAIIFIKGPAAIAGPPIAGALFEETNDYNIIMTFTGILLVVSAVIYISLPILNIVSSHCCKEDLTEAHMNMLPNSVSKTGVKEITLNC